MARRKASKTKVAIKNKSVDRPPVIKDEAVSQDKLLIAKKPVKTTTFIIAEHDPYIAGVKRFIAKRDGDVRVKVDGSLELPLNKKSLPVIDNYLLRANGNAEYFDRMLKISNEIKTQIKE